MMMSRLRGRLGAALAFSSSSTGGLPLDATVPAYEQLRLIVGDTPDDGGLTLLGIPGFAGFFLSLLERNDGWAISVTHGFAGEPGDVLIVAARDGDRVQEEGDPAVAAVEVFRRASALDAQRRQTMRAQASSA